MAAGDAFSQIRALAAAAIVHLCARRHCTSNEQSLQAVRAWWFSHMTRFLGAYIPNKRIEPMTSGARWECFDPVSVAH
jgi:hypothetical protein